MTPLPKSTRPRRRVVVVGPCASGKTTLVKRLMGNGIDAYVCAQEHSEIARLWNHLDPDVVVALDVDLETIRLRRGEDWPDTIYQAQIRRLRQAREHAEVIIDTTCTSANDTFSIALDRLTCLGVEPSLSNKVVPGSPQDTTLSIDSI